MEELEQQLNSILSDPKQMEQIAGLARSLMGGEKPEQSAPASSDLGFDPALLGRIASLMQSGGEGREQALLKAMAPYLSEKRRGKLDNALRLAKLARIARLAMETGGGDEAL
ncbi:MAG: hypothetical protein IJ649_01600, partial [Oscillospiraceae bacterium]|nr:hypothetical protein [Oscillospiraceae bacterium]